MLCMLSAQCIQIMMPKLVYKEITDRTIAANSFGSCVHSGLCYVCGLEACGICASAQSNGFAVVSTRAVQLKGVASTNKTDVGGSCRWAGLKDAMSLHRCFVFFVHDHRILASALSGRCMHN